MRHGINTHLRRYHLLLNSVSSRGSEAEVTWRSTNIGSWENISVRWWDAGGRIRIRFKAFQRDVAYWISSIHSTAGGMRISLTNARKPLPETLHIRWSGESQSAELQSEDSWQLAQRWLRAQFPEFQVLSVSLRPDLARSLSGSFLRVLFRANAREQLALVSALPDENGDSRRALGQALLCLGHYRGRHRMQAVPRIHLLVPSRDAGILYHRARFLNPGRVRVEVWEIVGRDAGNGQVRRAPCPPDPVEERDFRWPILGPFRWSAQLARVLDLAPHLIRRYPRFQDYDSLRLWGLEFARVMGPDRDRICFGVGTYKTDLDEDKFPELRALLDEITFYRRSDSPDIYHPYYRMQAERWLEALILEQVSALFPELAPDSVYSQIPVYLGRDPGRVDILGTDRHGNLVVMELKVSEDPDLPLQALDYWGRVSRHNVNGDFEQRGYFSGLHLSRGAPKIYLVSPVFAFHDSTEQMLRFLNPDLEVWKIAVNEDWRGGVKILRRLHLRCGDLT